MSIKRYAMSWGTDEDEFVYVSPTESTNGNWVKFDDYAALHYERIHDLNQIGGLQEENARLRAEVEALQNRCNFLEGRGL
jgi:hypothetical protein